MQKRQKKNRKPFGFRLFLVEVTGFEPATFWSRTKRATKLRYTSKYGANEGTRTLDLLITNQLLYQLSHIGVVGSLVTNHLTRKDYIRTGSESQPHFLLFLIFFR